MYMYKANVKAHISSNDIWLDPRQCFWLIFFIVDIAVLCGGETSVISALAPSDNYACNDKVGHSEEENGGNDEINRT